ncbi:MAG: hypothetical protein ABL996_02030 [Micropepsaceae bacterium]
MTALKSARILAASLGVLAFGALAATPAMAFDNLEWNWQKDVKEKVDIDVYIDVDVESTGLVEVEKLQIFLGDVTAHNYVYDIDNKPFYEGSGKDHNYDPKPHKRPTWDYGKDDGQYYVPDEKKHSYGPRKPVIVCFQQGPGCGGGGDYDKGDGWDKVPVKPLDARYELPIILASAQAIGNNQSISSDVPIFLHDGQFVANVRERCDLRCEWDPTAIMAGLPSSTGSFDSRGRYQEPEGNLHHKVALLFGLGAIFGVLEHAEIEAKSYVYDVTNVSVDNSSTAVANNISVNLASDVDGGTECKTGCKDRLSNHVVIADITQFALANVSATTKTYDVTATGYDHMRQLETKTLSQREGDPGYTISVPTPWISSTATAVGNNVTINVGRDLTPTAKP